VFNPMPEDATNLVNTINSNSPASDFSSDAVTDAAFMRLNEVPVPIPDTPSIANGRALFLSIGCGACHIQSHQAAASVFTGQSNRVYFPYSDFQLHNMGAGLADGVSQGDAGPADFRTAPLWGAGQRIFFLHDGRTTDILQAIEAHASKQANPKSEANTVISNFNALPAGSQQDILNFLRGL
jgi:CxxC motif-containing protein (DUF1111 family)